MQPFLGSGETPLEQAREYGRTEIVRFLQAVAWLQQVVFVISGWLKGTNITGYEQLQGFQPMFTNMSPEA